MTAFKRKKTYTRKANFKSSKKSNLKATLDEFPVIGGLVFLMLKPLIGIKNLVKPPKTPSRANSQGNREVTPVHKIDKKLALLSYLATFMLICVVGGVIGIVVLFGVFSSQLPNPNQLLQRDEELSTKLYDRNGKPISEVYGEKNRSLIVIEDVAPDLVHATLSVEDANFYNHQGFYLLGMIRAVKNTLMGQGLQGGSTLTQQVVKNAVLTQERTINRKLKELIMALQLEGTYTKDEIMQMYLNETPYGGQNYGIITAARAYFNKHPRDLTLAESAYLSGLPQSPTRYSYFGSNPQAGLDRKNYVLFLMHDRGWVGKDGKRYHLSDEEYENARGEELQFNVGRVHFEAPHFAFYTKEVLIDMFGEELVEQGGLEVTTTLDLDFQKDAQRIVKEEMGKIRGRAGNGAAVAIDPRSGDILVMVGSKDYFGSPEPEGCISGAPGAQGCIFDPNVNVTTASRQPGSSIKPITYATLLEQGYTAATPFMDVQTKFQGESPDKPYIPRNYDGLFRGPMSLRRVLANSLNIPAVKALKIAGVDNMIDTAERFGITTFKDRQRFGLAMTLGGAETKMIEMAGAFGVFANYGKKVQVSPIIEVKNAKGDVIYKRQMVEERVLDEKIAFLMSDILSDDGARSTIFGAGTNLNVSGHQVAVKTGTTDDLRDNHAVGYTREIVVSAWVGNNNNDRVTGVYSGGIGASSIWNRIMTSYLNGKEEQKFEPPAGVEKVVVDALTGGLPVEDFPTRSEWFIKGTEPTSQSEWFQRLEICREDGKLANDSCRDADQTRVRFFVDIRAELPEWQPYVDAWIGENYVGKPEYFPPRMVTALEFDDDGDVKEDTSPKVEITNFRDGDSAPQEFRLKVEVSSPNDVDYVRIYLDGEEITQDRSEPYGYNFSFEAGKLGEHKFKAVATDKRGKKGEREITLKVVAF